MLKTEPSKLSILWSKRSIGRIRNDRFGRLRITSMAYGLVQGCSNTIAIRTGVTTVLHQATDTFIWCETGCISHNIKESRYSCNFNYATIVGSISITIYQKLLLEVYKMESNYEPKCTSLLLSNSCLLLIKSPWIVKYILWSCVTF